MSKKLLLITLLAVTVLASEASAEFIIGKPDFSFDSIVGAGNGDFGGPGAHFDGATGFLAVSAQIQNITFPKGTIVSPTSATIDYRVKLSGSSFTPIPAAGFSVISASFETDGVAGPDLIIRDGGSVLVEGNIFSYSLTSIIPDSAGQSSTAFGESIFVVTGGSMASSFPSVAGGIVHLEFNVQPAFRSDTFTGGGSWSGHIKGNAGPVPEPATLFLFGTGCLGVAALKLKRRSRRKKERVA